MAVPPDREPGGRGRAGRGRGRPVGGWTGRRATVRGGPRAVRRPGRRPTSTPGSTPCSTTSGSTRELAAQEVSTLSGGQRAKVALAAIELSRFELTLLDEPTNDLDFEGLQRLETWVRSRPGGMVIVSHDRDFLGRTVATVLELDAHDRTGREYGGGWSGYQAERANARRHADEAYELYERRRGRAGGAGRAAAPVGHHRGPQGEPAAPGQRQGPAGLPHQPHREAGGQGPTDRSGP